jgi:hypothetical protein
VGFPFQGLFLFFAHRRRICSSGVLSQTLTLSGALVFQSREACTQLFEDSVHGGAMLRCVGIDVETGVYTIAEAGRRFAQEIVRRIVCWGGILL